MKKEYIYRFFDNLERSLYLQFPITNGHDQKNKMKRSEKWTS